MKKTKESLIPFEKSKRVIYLNERGKARRSISMGAVIFGVLGILCILYCIAIGLNGFGTKFFLIWGVMGALFLLLGFLLTRRSFVKALPGWLKVTATVAFCVGLIVFVVVEGLILSRFHGNARPGADYLLVLGAQ